MLYLVLFWTFFKIGLFSFGGGYAMIPIIQNEVVGRGWISAAQYTNIVTISQMTPGPLAVNTATYVGQLVGGIPGSMVATFGVSLPSFVLVILVAKCLGHFKNSSFVQSMLSGIRPVTLGLIASAIIFFSQQSVFSGNLPIKNLKILCQSFFTSTKSLNLNWAVELNIGGVFIFLIGLFACIYTKINPIWIILASAVLGIFLV